MNHVHKPYFHNMKIKKLSAKDTQLLCDQLSLLISEHISLLDASAIVRATYPVHGEFLYKNLQQGKSLGDTLDIFLRLPSYGRFLISVAEQSGALASGLRELAELMKERSALQKNILQAMFYPTVLLFASGILFCALLFFVLPKIRTVYDSVNAPLPVITTYLFFLSNHFLSIAVMVAATLFVLLSIFFLLKRIYKAKFHSVLIFLLRLRPICSIMSGLWTQSFFKGLHTATLSNAPFDTAVGIGLQSFPGYLFGVRKQYIIDRIKQGASFYQSLQECDRTWVFTPYSLAVVRLIEYSVPIERVCTIINVLAQQELQRRLKLFERLSEPLILTLVACVIGGVAFAVLMPLYSLTQHLNVR